MRRRRVIALLGLALVMSVLVGLLVGRRTLSSVLGAARETAAERDHEFDQGSRIEPRALSSHEVENLVLLAKVWGFVKYHDPRITAGQRHWDYELFRVVPRVLAAGSPDAAADTIVQWLDSLGPLPACDPCAKIVRDARVLPRLDWIRDHRFVGRTLAERLQRIYVNRDADLDQAWVAIRPPVGNPSFSNERAYANVEWPDAGYGLLALYRFWNIIEYWFPYRNDVGEDWDQVLAEFVPRVFRGETKDDYVLAMLALVARARDGHANVWSHIDDRPPKGPCHFPATLRIAEGRLIVTSIDDSALVAPAGLRTGDVVRSVDGEPIPDILGRVREYYGASNDASRLRDLAAAVTRGACGPCSLGVERAGRDLTIRTMRVTRPDTAAIRRIRARDRQGQAFRRLSDDLAYLKLSRVEASRCAEYVAGAAGARCLIVDLRCYPSEFVVFALGRHLVSESTPFAKFTVGDLSNPGAFTETPVLSLEPKAPRFEGRVAILVDERTQSQAEYTTMAFRVAPGAIVVGSTTAGADGNVSPVPLPGDLRAAISGIGVYYPDGRPTQRVGIVPDIEVRPTIAGLRAGRDEGLETAVQAVLGRAPSEAELVALSEEAKRP